jgi:hypothetical protein
MTLHTTAAPGRIDGAGWLLAGLAALTLANSLWMLVAPAAWYQHLPAGVPDFGPFNPHFVRDIGCAFATVGIALAWAVRSGLHRYPLTAVATLFFLAHALLHVFDTLRGAVDATHWLLDLPGVYLPVVALAMLTRRFKRESEAVG